MPSSLMEGYRALDLTDEKGFLCGNILADLGVEVIKIEKPGGDSSRHIPPFYHDEPDAEKSLYWFAYNANKRSITLNLETQAGRDLFRKLVENADFVIESFPPGYMASIGLGYEDLARINPRIIMTSITPFGQNGPYAHLPADSDLVLQALSSMLLRTGDPDRPPVQISSVPQAYLHAASDAAEGTMIAHYYRSLTGEGQHVDVSIMESVLGDAVAMGDFSAYGQEAKRSGSYFVSAGLSTPIIWACKDGFVNFMLRGGAVGSPTNRALTEWMDSEGMAPAFMKQIDWDTWDWMKTSQAELDALKEAIEPFFQKFTKDEIVREGTKRGMLISKVSDMSDLLKDEQLYARGFWVGVQHDELGRSIVYPGAFAKFSLTPLENYRRAPLIGEHNEEVYEQLLNLSPQEMERLRSEGVI